MHIHKDLIELMGCSQIIGGTNGQGGYTIVPISIDVDDVNFEVTFHAYDQNKRRRSFTRRGKHNNFIFTTSVDNIPFTINADGIIKKVRKR